jgi:hypothetical protein
VSGGAPASQCYSPGRAKTQGAYETPVYNSLVELQGFEGSDRIAVEALIGAAIRGFVRDPKNQKRDRSRQKATRAISGLKKRGLIHVDNDFAWVRRRTVIASSCDANHSISGKPA